jgi:hypothetical protein
VKDHMRTKILLATIFVVTVTGPACAADCAGLTKELNRLRLEYKEYGTKTDKTGVTFDGLTEILDKIVKVKAEMRKNCKKIPPRK